MALTREQFANAMRRRFIEREIPGLDGVCRFQSLTQREMGDIRRGWFDDKGNKDLERLRRVDQFVVAASLVDDNGNRIVSDDDVMRGFFDHIDGGPWAVICAIVKRHTGWDAGEEWEPVQVALKNC